MGLYKTLVYRKKGGAELVVASGGKINIESGGDLEYNGASLIDEMAALNGLDATEVGYLNAATPGTIEANKVLVPTAASAALLNAVLGIPTTYIVVSENGDDTTGKGSFALPYKTFTKAFTVWNATRHTIYGLAGEYAEAATLTWPAVNGLSLVALGPVSVSNADAAAQVLLIQPGAAATASFVATLKGPLNLDADTQIGLKIANAAMTKKLIVDIDGLSCEMDTSGASIAIAGTVAGQAIRVYAKNINLEGLLDYTVNDAGSRLRVDGASALMGGLTGTGAVAAEVTLKGVTVLTGGLSVDGAQQLTNVGCVYATDADPAVYTVLADAFAT